VVATAETSGATPQSLAALMVGHDIEVVRRPAQDREAAPAALEITGLSVDGDRGTVAVEDVSLAVHEGEIVAVAGVAGNGQRELAEAVAGLRPCAKGAIRVGGKPLRPGDARAAYDAGVAYIPEDRLGTGVSPTLPLSMNLQLRSFRRESVGPFLRLGQMREKAVAAIEDFDIKASGPDVETDHLSGGNVQKVVIAREFSSSMNVLVAASPTRGLDVAAVETVHRYLLDAAEAGAGVLLLSEDLDEILALNDRVVVMYEGSLSEVHDSGSIEEIGLRMAGETPD